MNDDDLKEFANQFIQTWQENFAKLGADSEFLELFAGNLSNMQQFYDKSTSTTSGNTSKPGPDLLKWRELELRVDEIERKLESFGEVKQRSKKRSAK